MRYLVDTDWILDGLAHIPSAFDVLQQLSVAGLAVRTVSLAEIFEGAYISLQPDQELGRFQQFLSGYAKLPVTEAVASRFAQVRAMLRQQGNLIPDLDLLIAATALEHDLVLLTRNRRHFERIPGLKLYDPAIPDQ